MSNTEEQGRYPVQLPPDLRETLDKATLDSLRKMPQEITYALLQYYRFREIIESLTWLKKTSEKSGKTISNEELIYKLFVAMTATVDRKAS